MSSDAQPDQLDEEILSSVGELIGQILAHGESLAQRHSFPTFFLKALHTLSAYATNARLTLSQLSVPEKTNEITAIVRPPATASAGRSQRSRPSSGVGSI